MSVNPPEQIGLSLERTTFLESICVEGSETDLDYSGKDSSKGEFYFAEQKHAYRSAIAIAIAQNLLPDSSRRGTRKTKWQGSAIFDDQMNSFLALYGIDTDDQDHFQVKAMLLAEAGIDFLSLKRTSGESLWPYILAEQTNI